ncbi:MAG: 4Fe-4S dicluster-binding protein [Eubacteriales bacterium]|jgi:pyruvate ferredoxin oxidoreductase delta subunit
MVRSEEDLKWKDLETGCVVSDAGNASQYRTGDWRSLQPVWDKTKCIRCGVCFLFCPDAAIRKTSEGYFEADLYYCKGCGICVQECVTGCITMVEEEE